MNQQSLYRHSTGLPNILHQFASHFPHAPLSLMYITPVRRSSFRMRSCLSLLVRQPDTSEPHTIPRRVKKLESSEVYVFGGISLTNGVIAESLSWSVWARHRIGMWATPYSEASIAAFGSASHPFSR